MSEMPSERNQHLECVLADYLRAVQAGQSPNRAEFLARHPDLADELLSFFHNRDALQRLAEPLANQGLGLDETVGTQERAEVGVDTTVRYFGDYELLQEIARGGMGVVYKARQVSLQRIVALKMILVGELASQEDVSRFRQEATMAANLDHANIVPIYEVGAHHGQQYFSMKLVEGGSLQVLRGQQLGNSKAGQRRAAQLVATVAQAVHYAHQHGLLHRDLKPGNILLNEAGEPLVTDFGLAKRVHSSSDLTQTGAVVGTPSYMAPEQARAEKQLTTAADVYSLGAILYDLLTGQPPHRGESPLVTLVQVLEREPVSPQLRQPLLDRDLATICLKCLNKEPERRYESAAALAEDLKRWLNHEPILARAPGRVERLAKWSRRHPAVAALLAVVVLLISIGFPVLTWQLLELRRHEQIARTELRRAETALYAQRVARAHALWKGNDVQRASALLEECPKALRGWEWQYVRGLCDDCLLNVKAARDMVPSQLCVAFSPDGRLLASASQSPVYARGKSDHWGEIHVWDLRSGQEAIHLQGQPGPMSCGVAFSPDGKLLASGGWEPGADGVRGPPSVKVWNVMTGQVVYTFSGSSNFPSVVEAVAFSPDGRILAASTNETILLCDASTGKAVRSLGEGGKSLSFSPDGRFLATAGDSLRVWKVDTGERQIPVVPQTHVQLPAAKEIISQVAYSPDGRRLVTAGSAVRIWEARTGVELARLGNPEWFTTVAWSPDGRIAVGSADRSIKVYDADSTLELFTLRGHGKHVQHVVFSPDGSLIASGSSDQTVRVWDATHGQEVHILHEGNFRTGNHRTHGIVLSPQGKKLALAFGEGPARDNLAIKVCATDTGRVLLSRNNLGLLRYPRLVRMAFSPGEEQFAIATGNKVRLWDLLRGEERPALKASGEIDQIIFSPDGNTVALPLWSGPIKLHNLADGKEVLSLETDTHEMNRFAPRLAFSPDGSLAALVSPWPASELRLVETRRGNVIRTLRGSDGTPVSVSSLGSLAFSSDGRRLLLCDSIPNGRILVWESNSGRLLQAQQELSGLRASISAFSPDGSRLATAAATEPMEVALWDTSTGQEVFVWQDTNSVIGGREVQTLSWSADGSHLIVGDEFGDIRLWSAASRTPEAQAVRRLGWENTALKWHQRAARDCERERQWFGAAFHLPQASAANPTDSSMLLRSCLANIRAERWAEAATDLGNLFNRMAKDIPSAGP